MVISHIKSIKRGGAFLDTVAAALELVCFTSTIRENEKTPPILILFLTR